MFYYRGYTSQKELVKGLQSTNVLSNERASKAMLEIDRSFYAPRQAYEDAPQSLGYGQTISAPHMHAWCLDLLSDYLKPGARVLDVGSGSGVMTALMGHMVSPNGKVFGIDTVVELVQLSEINLATDPKARRMMEEGTISVQVGDGWKGLPKEGPFDAIHVGAGAETMPEALVDQLAAPGRMLIPVGPQGAQEMLRVDKDAAGKVKTTKITDVMYVPLVKNSAF